MKGDKRIRELKDMAKAYGEFKTLATYENPYQDDYTHIFLMELDNTITSVVIAQQTSNYVNGEETYSEIWLSLNDYEKITTWIKEKLNLLNP
jgi:hypothetical protein